MQVTAYKDLVTGLLFEDKTKLDEFLANRRKEEAAETQRRSERAKAAAFRQTLCRELDSQEAFERLALKMYEYALGTTKLKRNKKALKVLALTVKKWTVNSQLLLTMDVEVELSGNPGHTYADTFVKLTPPDVLYPFQLWGCGSSKDTRPGFSYFYSLQAPLSKFPKLLAKMRRAAELLREQDAHEARIEEAFKARKSTDPKLAELAATTEAARQAFETAQHSYLAAAAAQRAQESRLEDEAHQAMPFASQAELDELCEATSMPGVGQTDRWLALAVRNALLNPESETAEAQT